MTTAAILPGRRASSWLDRRIGGPGLACVALFVAAASVYVSAVLGVHLQPDFNLYVRGGIHLYPSPIGTAIGSLGPRVLEVVSALCSALSIALVGIIARQRRAVVASLSTFAAFAFLAGGVDSIAALLVLLGYAAASGRFRAPLLVVAALVHPAAAPFALLRLRLRWALPLACGAIAALVLTPYGGIFAGGLASLVGVGGYALLAFGLLVLPLVALLGGRCFTSWLPLALLGIAALESGAEHHLQLRYGLPAVLVAAVVWGSDVATARSLGTLWAAEQ